MGLFAEWLEAKKNLKEAGLAGFMPNMGQRAIPINQGATPQASPAQQAAQQPAQEGSLTQRLLAAVTQMEDQHKVLNPDWIQLVGVFQRYATRAPNDPANVQFGTALLQAGKTGDMKLIQPYVMKHLKAQRA